MGDSDSFIPGENPLLGPAETEVSTRVSASGVILLVAWPVIAGFLLAAAWRERVVKKGEGRRGDRLEPAGPVWLLLLQLEHVGGLCLLSFFLLLAIVARTASVGGAVGIAGALAFIAACSLGALSLEHHQLRKVGQDADYRSPVQATDAAARAPSLLLTWFMRIEADRRLFQRILERTHSRIYELFLVVLLLVVYTGFADYSQIISSQPTFFRSYELDWIATQAATHYEPDFEAGMDEPDATHRVVLVVVDGLRWDFATETSQSPVLPGFFAGSDDGVLLAMRASLPSMSVPNWLTLITGTRPEFHGLLGNLLAPETLFDSIFHVAARYAVTRGMTGSPWFSQIVRTQLPVLSGDGTLSTGAGGGGSDSADPADRLRYEVLETALEEDYRLFLAHFSDVDLQGHAHGVDAGGLYRSAVANKTAILEDLRARLGPETTLLVVADHGHANRGGHGGTSDLMLNVPLYVYRAGSGLASRLTLDEGNLLPGNSEPLPNIVVAPTICALLDLPPPRTSSGQFIEPLLRLLSPSESYLDRHSAASEAQQVLLRAAIVNRTVVDPVDSSTIAASANLTESELLHEAQSETAAVNVVVTLLWVAATAAYCGRLLSRYSPLAPTTNKSHRRLIVRGFLLPFVHVIFSAILYVICYTVYGHELSDVFESTMIHTPAVIPTYIAFCMIPSSLLALALLVWSEQVMAPGDTVRARVSAVLRGATDTSDNAASFYVLRLSLALGCFGAQLLFLLAVPAWDSVLPGWTPMSLVSPFNWSLRFAALTLMFMALPLHIASFVIFARALVPPADATLNYRDGLYAHLYECLQNRGMANEESAFALVLRALATDGQVPDEAAVEEAVAATSLDDLFVHVGHSQRKGVRRRRRRAMEL